MSDWMSLNEIMRDLSVAQGRTVPASLQTFSDTELPPLKIKEETAEAYYKSCGDVDFSKPPDFNLIQEMLSMVTNKTETLDDATILNSNLNPLSPEFVPQTSRQKKRAQKNVAMKSILETQAKTLSGTQPDHLVPPFSPINMFKKKSTSNKAKKVAGNSATESRNTKICQYTPSMLASHYYNKYLANAQLREQIQLEIWTRAEQKMTEIDERKKRIRMSSSSSSQDLGEDVSMDSATKSFSSGLDFVSLPNHRHLILDSIEACVVCYVAAKHGYSFKDEVS